MTSHGIIRSWDFENDHGVIDSVDTPGGCRVTTSDVLVEGVALATGDHLSHIGLPAGEAVDFEFGTDEYNDTDFAHQAFAVWPSRCTAPTQIPRGAFRIAVWSIANGDDGLRIARQADPADLPPAPPRDLLPRTTGTVRSWNPNVGWGVIDSPETPGGAWAFFSDIRGVSGYPLLTAGATVEFGWETANQDGFYYRANDIHIVEQPNLPGMPGRSIPKNQTHPH